MKCPVTGKECSSEETFEVKIILGNEKGVFGEGRLTSPATGEPVTVCPECKDECTISTFVNDHECEANNKVHREHKAPEALKGKSHLEFKPSKKRK